MRWGTAAGSVGRGRRVALLGALWCVPQPQGSRRRTTVRMHSLSPGDTVYVLLDGGGHSLAVVDEDRGGVVLIDAKSAGWGQTVIADAVALVTELPVTTIVNTHGHADQTGGNGEFRRTPSASSRTRTRMPTPRDRIVGGRGTVPRHAWRPCSTAPNRIELYHFGPGPHRRRHRRRLPREGRGARGRSHQRQGGAGHRPGARRQRRRLPGDAGQARRGDRRRRHRDYQPRRHAARAGRARHAADDDVGGRRGVRGLHAGFPGGGAGGHGRGQGRRRGRRDAPAAGALRGLRHGAGGGQRADHLRRAARPAGRRQ